MSDGIAQFKKEASDYSSRVLSDTSMMSEEDYKLLEYSLNKEWSNPKFKMRWFVGETQITPFSKVRQWILEIKSREEAIENLEYEIKKYQVTRTQIMTKRRLVNWYLERQQIIDLVNEFNESPEALLPDGSGRTYMDIMDTDEEDIYEAEFWTNRLAKQAATDLLFYGRVGTGNMDAILSMAPEHQTQTLTLAMSYGTQLQKINENIQLQVDETLSLGDKSDNAFLTTPLSLQEATQKLTMDTKSATAGPVGDDILNVYNK